MTAVGSSAEISGPKQVVAITLHKDLDTAEKDVTSGKMDITLNSAFNSGAEGEDANYDNMFDEMEAEMEEEEEEPEVEEEVPEENLDSDVEDMFAQIESGNWGQKEDNKANDAQGQPPGSPPAGAPITLETHDTMELDDGMPANQDYSGSCDPRVIGYEKAMKVVRATKHDTNELVAVLLQPGVDVMESLQAMLPQAAFRPFADLMLELASGFNQGHLLVADCITKDLDAASGGSDTSTIFRTETIYVRLMCQFVEKQGRQWVKELLEPVVAQILQLELENDPSKLVFEDEEMNQDTVSAVLEQARNNMEKALLMVLDAVEAAADSLPWQIEWAMHTAHECVRAKFEDKEVPLCGSLLFLRFICPTMTNPKVVGIDLKVGKPERRKLILVTKLLQIMANGILQPESEGAPINQFMNQQIPKIQQIILRHAKLEPARADHEWHQAEDVSVLAVPLAHFLLEHEGALMKHAGGSVSPADEPIICKVVRELPQKYREEPQEEETSAGDVNKKEKNKPTKPDESNGCCMVQ